VVLFNAGDQVPEMPLLEVVGKALKLAPEHIALTAVNVGVTFGFTVTTSAVLVAEQPLASVTVTVYDPAAVAVYVAPVPTVDDPLLQEYNEPELADKTTLPPEQNVVDVAGVIVAVGNAFTVILSVVVVAQSPAVGVNV
jgi:hypothetical protein